MPYDRDQIANLDAEIDALSTPTTEEVFAHSKDYNPDFVAASAVRRTLGGSGLPAGGSTGQVLTKASDADGDADWEAGGSSPVCVATKTLTDAEIRHLPTTPIQILAAQGEGTIVVPLHATLRLDWTADYTNIDDAAVILLRSGTNQFSGMLRQDIDTGVAALLASGGSDGAIALLPFDALSVSPAVTSEALPMPQSFFRVFADSGFFDSDISNKAIFLFADNGGSGDFADGDPANTLKVTLLYYVVEF